MIYRRSYVYLDLALSIKIHRPVFGPTKRAKPSVQEYEKHCVLTLSLGRPGHAANAGLAYLHALKIFLGGDLAPQSRSVEHVHTQSGEETGYTNTIPT
jgi:hypothetical protein